MNDYAEFNRPSHVEPLFEPSTAFFISVTKWAVLGAVLGFGLAFLCVLL